MKVAILGTGNVGQALGRGFISKGYEVKIGSRESKNEKAQAWAGSNGNKASCGTFAEAAAFGDFIVLATLWTGTENAIKLANPKNFSGKLVMDVTNPLKIVHGSPSLAIGTTDSGGETVQRWLSDAQVVKAFNTVGNAHMVDPKFAGGPPDMFICGNEPAAKKKVAEICTAFGWNSVDVGGIESSRYLEPMCMLWVKYGFLTNSWNHAFKLLKK